MLRHSKLLISIIILTASLFSQSLLNGYGLGNLVNSHDASSAGISSTGLLPGFSKDVSLSNPLTWKNLNFTYLSGSYLAEQVNIPNNVINQYSDLNSARLIVPIKNKYAIGFGVKPITTQSLQVTSKDTNTVITYSDTLNTHHSVQSYGGINAFTFSFGGEITKYFDAALALDLLYGSSRQQTILSINELDYYSQQRHLYSGSLATVFFNTNYLSELKIPANLYFSFSFPLQSLTIKSSYYKPFEDINNSGSQDDADFPKLSDADIAEEIEIKKACSSAEYKLGIDFELSSNLHLMSEYSSWKDVKDNNLQFSTLNDRISNRNHFNLSMVRFTPRVSKNILDKFKYRSGFYIKNQELFYSEILIKEYGISAGVGFNFGETNNQIDFAYSYGKRSGLPEIDNEIIQNFTVGITIGDLWFIKRRAQ